MVDGKVLQVSADATDKSNSTNNQSENQNTSGPTTQLVYRTIVQLDKQHLSIEQEKL